MTERQLTQFETRWLAEATRLRESYAGPLEDSAANRAARAGGGTLESRVMRRALELDAAKGGLRQRLVEWTQHARWASLILAALAVLTGASLGASVLGDGQRPVNVVWAIGGLLGLHFITLLVWCLGFVAPGVASGALAGRIWLWATRWLGRRHTDAWLPEAGLAMAREGKVVPAWLGRLSHGLWTLILLSALISLLALLATRRYGFVWETTILTEDVFVALVRSLGALPSLLGIAMPDAEMVARAAAPEATAVDGRIWSAWLVCALILYGLVPRVLLWAWSTWRWRRFTRQFRLDLDDPAYARLVRALMPASDETRVTDADPGVIPHLSAHPTPNTHGSSQLLVALELGPDLEWPPADWHAADVGGRLDSRESRRRILDALASAPAQRLMVAVDTRLSPDRGAGALLAELSQYAGALAVWLRGGGERAGLWRDMLRDLGIDARGQFDKGAAARAWLEDTNE